MCITSVCECVCVDLARMALVMPSSTVLPTRAVWEGVWEGVRGRVLASDLGEVRVRG